MGTFNPTEYLDGLQAKSSEPLEPTANLLQRISLNDAASTLIEALAERMSFEQLDAALNLLLGVQERIDGTAPMLPSGAEIDSMMILLGALRPEGDARNDDALAS